MQINNFNFNKMYVPNFKQNSEIEHVQSDKEQQQKQDSDMKKTSEVAKAYASPQINKTDCKLVETASIPYIGDASIYKLANNHTVVLVEKEGLTTIQTGINAGNGNAPEGKEGIAHLTEHLLANKLFNDKSTLENAYNNAMTSLSSTNYYISSPIENKKELEALIKAQYEIMSDSEFSNEEIEKEKKIICQEHAIRSCLEHKKNNADVENAVIKNLHGIEDKIVPESDASINSITKEDLDLFYKQNYQPKNMVTVMVGDFKKEDALDLINKYFGQDKNSNIEVPQEIKKSKPTNVKNIELTNHDPKVKSTIQEFFIGLPALTGKEEIINQLMTAIIMDKGEELYDDDNKNIYLVKQNTHKIKNQNANYQEMIFVDYSEKNAEKIKNLFELLKTNPISKKDLKSLKGEWYHQTLNENEYSDSIADYLLSIYLEKGNLDYIKNYENNLNSITVQDIKDFANKYYDFDKVLTITTKPQKIEGSKEISFGSSIKDDVKEYELPNNLKVVVDTRKGVATTTIRFDINALQAPTPEIPATSYVLNSVRGSRDGSEIAKEDNISKSMKFTNDKFMSIQTNCAPENTKQAIDVAFDSLLNCDLGHLTYDIEHRKEEKEEREKDKDPIEIKEREDRKEKRIQIEKLLYNNTPYKSSIEGVEKVSQTDVLKLHSDLISNGSGIVFITMPKDEFEKQKDDIFKKLSAFPKMKKYDFQEMFDNVKDIPLEKNEVFCLKDKNAKEVQIEQIFNLYTSGKMEDRVALMVLNNVIGEDVDSKMFNEIREKEKLCYETESDCSIGRLSSKLGTYSLTTTTSADTPENIEKIVKKYQQIIDDVCTNEISEEELQRLKTKIKKATKFESEGSLSRNLQIATGYNTLYGLNYAEEFEAAIDKLTPKDIKDVANKYLKQHYILEVSGNTEAIEKNEEFLNSLKG
ncbi:MAG: insulinase family protein [bacterium]|nr:insulinase family protein [bacterium]